MKTESDARTMGFSIDLCNHPSIAPRFLFNHAPAPSWGGKESGALSVIEISELLKFCDDEGFRRGWNSGISPCGRSEDGNPFHGDFLDGVPNRKWSDSYRMGMLQAEKYKSETKGD